MTDTAVDTSPYAIARELRALAVYVPADTTHTATYNRALDLADTLLAEASMAWEDRVERANEACFSALCQARQTGLNTRDMTIITIALRAAFPNLAPPAEE